MSEPYTLELADSEVRHLIWHGADLHVVFSAAAVSRRDAATGELALGYWRGAALVLQAAQTAAPWTEAIGRLRAGRCLDAQAQRLALTLPGEHAAPVRLELNFAHGTSLLLSALGLAVQAAPDGAFFPSLAC